jgi:hypothetical protein
MKDQNRVELNNYINELFQRQPTKVIKNHKGYDRARDRKDPRLYEVEENNIAVDEESQSVF